jgi:hypothetical protein
MQKYQWEIRIDHFALVHKQAINRWNYPIFSFWRVKVDLKSEVIQDLLSKEKPCFAIWQP